MLLVLLPHCLAPTALESLVELCLAASELFKPRKAVIAYRGFRLFFPERIWGEEAQIWAGRAESWLTQSWLTQQS